MGHHIYRLSIVLLAGLLLSAGASSGSAFAQDDNGSSPCAAWDFVCAETVGGVYIASPSDAADLRQEYPTDGEGKPIMGATYRYVSVLACDQNTPEQPRLELCTQAATFCATLLPPQGGPFAWVYRQEVLTDGTQGPWTRIATTCFPDAIPGSSDPGLTRASAKSVGRALTCRVG